MPLFPALIPSQVCSTLCPSGLIIPRPVTTTRRVIQSPLLRPGCPQRPANKISALYQTVCTIADTHLPASSSRVLAVVWRGQIMPLDPGFAIGSDFFFPDRDNFLEAVDAIASGFKTALVTMTGGTGNQNGV